MQPISNTLQNTRDTNAANAVEAVAQNLRIAKEELNKDKQRLQAMNHLLAQLRKKNTVAERDDRVVSQRCDGLEAEIMRTKAGISSRRAELGRLDQLKQNARKERVDLEANITVTLENSKDTRNSYIQATLFVMNKVATFLEECNPKHLSQQIATKKQQLDVNRARIAKFPPSLREKAQQIHARRAAGEVCPINDVTATNHSPGSNKSPVDIAATTAVAIKDCQEQLQAVATKREQVGTRHGTSVRELTAKRDAVREEYEATTRHMQGLPADEEGEQGDN